MSFIQNTASIPYILVWIISKCHRYAYETIWILEENLNGFFIKKKKWEWGKQFVTQSVW